MSNKRSRISIEVELNENNMPENIFWNAEDDPQNRGEQVSKALLLSMFDKSTLETVKIDLWTQDFQVQEMDRLMFQSLRSMADTYFRATKNEKLASAMQQFAQYFGEETNIVPKKS